jgi:hypothetical protein
MLWYVFPLQKPKDQGQLDKISFCQYLSSPSPLYALLSMLLSSPLFALILLPHAFRYV